MSYIITAMGSDLQEAVEYFEMVEHNNGPDAMVHFGPVARMEMLRQYKLARTALAALRGPQPDPDTGLVPCGCGQPLALKHNPGRCEVPYDDPSDPDNWTKRPTWWVECKKCGLAIGKWHDEDFSEERGWYDSAEEAVHAANRAMGVKGADE